MSFQYPKTWSVYISNDGTDGGDYEAYFRPDYIDSIENSDSRHALRFFIRNESFDSIQREYKGKVDEGELRSSIFNKGSNLTGMRYEGTLEEGMEGVVVIVKINDKTAILQTDARVFQDDFNKLIDTLTRNSD